MKRTTESSKTYILTALTCVGVVILIIMLGVHMNDTSTWTSPLNGNSLTSSVQEKALPIVPPTMDCEVAIVGGGPGGLVTAYRLAKILGSKVCLIDDRDHVGGKVKSIREVGSTSARPVWTPTHAEQLRGGDSILRCLAQEVGNIMVVRGTPGTFYDYNALGMNVTGFMCFGNQTPTGAALCAAGNPWEGILAPNGYTGSSPYGADMPNLCGNKDWKTCSYTDECFTFLAQNANLIVPGESYIEFFTRILGENAARYYSDQYGYSYMNEFDARAMIDYLNYDNAYAYGHVHMDHGGPQAGIWERVAKLIVGNGTRIVLKTRITSIDKNANTNVYTLRANGVVVTAKRVVLAFPPSHLATMTGSVVETLKQSPFVTYSKPNHACTWNAFFPSKWWQKYASTCNIGWCASVKKFNLSAYAREYYMGWNYHDTSDSPDSLDYIQYVPTPERIEGNLLRFFFEEAPCREFDALFASGGGSAIQTELMRRVRLQLGAAVGTRIPNPTEAYYSSELYAYSGLAPGAPFRATDWLQWGAEPMPGEKLCFATEGINMLDSGWQEGAAKVAHNCLKGNVFKDLIASTTLQALERCRANISNGANRYLDGGNKNSGNDICLLLRNEYHMRDLAGYTVCGSPKVYDYPTLASFTNSAIQPSQILWSSAVSTAQYDTKPSPRRGRHIL